MTWAEIELSRWYTVQLRITCTNCAAWLSPGCAVLFCLGEAPEGSQWCPVDESSCFPLGLWAQSHCLWPGPYKRHLCQWWHLSVSSCSEYEAERLTNRSLEDEDCHIFWQHQPCSVSTKMVFLLISDQILQMVIWALQRIVQVFSYIYLAHMNWAIYCTAWPMHVTILAFTLCK